MTNADCIKRQNPKEDELLAISKIVSINDSSSYLTLDDPNLTKSVQMASLKQRATKIINLDFNNLTKNVFDQKESNLCVPISVTSLIRHALKYDLNFDDEYNNYSIEKLLTIFTMVIYPRSLSGLNLNPNTDEKDFQSTETELLLKRLKNHTYLMKSGWEIIRKMGHPNIPKSVFKYETVILNKNFIFSRPLTVTGAYLVSKGLIKFHQMTLDRIEECNYVLQNTMLSIDAPILRIKMDNPYYVTPERIYQKLSLKQESLIMLHDNVSMDMVNENFGEMKKEKCYLLPKAYSLSLSLV
ncbi:unnamed protein product [Oikopleura dioica]|uniref:Uncharacterized protein n=2 Tax=Oikopleura dioica TaxID=34765 RepID=E4WSI2_OIKDI|nr:unnamed protein product [Oikopleura dioica]